MADAYKCDRCKQFFDGKPFASATVRPFDEEGQTKFYKCVCLECAANIKAYVEGTTRLDTPEVLKMLQNCGIDTECGACMSIAFTGAPGNLIHEHGCSMRPACTCWTNSSQRIGESTP